MRGLLPMDQTAPDDRIAKIESASRFRKKSMRDVRTDVAHIHQVKVPLNAEWFYICDLDEYATVGSATQRALGIGNAKVGSASQ